MTGDKMNKVTGSLECKSLRQPCAKKGKKSQANKTERKRNNINKEMGWGG
jgi:hypothetical protein